MWLLNQIYSVFYLRNPIFGLFCDGDKWWWNWQDGGQETARPQLWLVKFLHELSVLLNTNHFFLAHKLRNIWSFSDHDLWPPSNPTKWLRLSCEVISLLSSALHHNTFIMNKNVPCLENQKHCFWIIHFALFPWPLSGIQKAHLSYPSLGNGSRVWIVGLELVALASR